MQMPLTKIMLCICLYEVWSKLKSKEGVVSDSLMAQFFSVASLWFEKVNLWHFHLQDDFFFFFVCEFIYHFFLRVFVYCMYSPAEAKCRNELFK